MPLSHERPSVEYMRELRAVARSAGALREHLRGVNALPNSFPCNEINHHCDALILLPEGTAAGSIYTLQAAESDLKRIQQKNFPLAPEEDEEPSDELLSIIQRGGQLDQRVAATVNAVGLAIECYKRESGDAIETDTSPEPTAAPDLSEERSDLTENAQFADRKAGEVCATFDTIRNPNSKKADSYRRTLNDVQAQARSVKGVLANPAPRPSVAERLGTGMQHTATALNTIGKSLELGSDLGKVANDTWSELQRQGIDGLLTAVRTLGSGLRQMAAKIDEFRKKELPSKPSQETGADFDYAEVYSRLLRGEAVPEAWAPHVSTLDFHFGERHHLDAATRGRIEGDPGSFSSARLLAPLTALQSLVLWNTQVTDIAPLENLTALQSLNLRRTKVTDIAPLATLTALQSLVLWSTQVTDIAPLENLKALQSLYLRNTEVTDIAPLEGLTALQYLDLRNTQVTDIAPLEGLTALQYLDLSHTKVTDIAPLANLMALESLHLINTQVTNIAPLENLKALQSLDLAGTQVTDIAPLQKLVEAGLKIFGP